MGPEPLEDRIVEAVKGGDDVDIARVSDFADVLGLRRKGGVTREGED